MPAYTESHSTAAALRDKSTSGPCHKVTSTSTLGSALPVLTCHKDTQVFSVTAALLRSLLESGTDGLLEGSAPADVEA